MSATGRVRPMLSAVVALTLMTGVAYGQVQVKTRADVIRLVDELAAHLSDLERSHERYRAAAEGLAVMHGRLSRKADEVARLAEAAKRATRPDGKALDDLYASVQQMREMQMTFNLQYLQLQNQMQAENRQFTMVSNIMKTKHDTVKNSISNIR